MAGWERSSHFVLCEVDTEAHKRKLWSIPHSFLEQGEHISQAQTRMHVVIDCKFVAKLRKEHSLCEETKERAVDCKFVTKITDKIL